jgi:2-desacetyl-2-hydroxyethyl bacteriochlorophyllide A dehydrogenase
MRAAFCTGAGSIEVRTVDAPTATPTGTDTVVAVHACGICGSDLHYWAGNDPPPTVCLGHEICGRLITAAGALSVGTPVVVEPLVACGACPRCRAGEPNLCPRVRILGSMLAGGLADAVCVPADSVYPVPAGLDLDTAVLAEPLAVAVHAVRLAALGPSDEVLVLGAGSIGLLTAFVALQAGSRVAISARHPHQAAAAATLGIPTVIAADEPAVRAAARRSRPDVILETVGGRARTLELALRVVRPGGRIVALGKFSAPITLDPIRFLMKEVQLISSMTYSRRKPEPDFVTALRILADAPRPLASLVTHRVPLADVARGFALAADKNQGAIKVAITTGTP